MKVTFSDRFTLGLVSLYFLVYLCTHFIPSTSSYFALQGEFNFSSAKWLLNLISYPFGIKSFPDFITNTGMILLLVPSLEKKMGLKFLFLAVFTTILLMALTHIICFDGFLSGMNGVILLLVILSALIQTKSSELSLTFLLILVLFVGREVYNNIEAKQVFNFVNLMGAVGGVVWGMYKR